MDNLKDYTQAVRVFNRFLESKRLRKTPERFALLRAAWHMPPHFGIDALHEALENQGFHVSRATAYNAVDLMVECGVLVRHTFTGGEAKYEPVREGHIHLVCKRCGAISEAASPSLMEQMLRPQEYGGFQPQMVQAYVWGLCDDCRTKENRAGIN